jgi:hypothetical protein
MVLAPLLEVSESVALDRIEPLAAAEEEKANGGGAQAMETVWRHMQGAVQWASPVPLMRIAIRCWKGETDRADQNERPGD